MKSFNAPWGTSLWAMSALATGVCVAASVFAGQKAGVWIGIIPLLIVVGAVPFIVRGYAVTSDSILVERLFWTTRLPLAGLQSARFEPDAVRGSIRTCGNGGLFSFTGWYWNKRLGAHRAFVTDPKRIVVLKFPKRTIVLSPNMPEDFVRNLSTAVSLGR